MEKSGKNLLKNFIEMPLTINSKTLLFKKKKIGLSIATYSKLEHTNKNITLTNMQRFA